MEQSRRSRCEPDEWMNVNRMSFCWLQQRRSIAIRGWYRVQRLKKTLAIARKMDAARVFECGNVTRI